MYVYVCVCLHVHDRSRRKARTFAFSWKTGDMLFLELTLSDLESNQVRRVNNLSQSSMRAQGETTAIPVIIIITIIVIIITIPVIVTVMDCLRLWSNRH